MKNSNGFGLIGVVIIITAIALIGLVWWGYYNASMLRTYPSSDESVPSDQAIRPDDELVEQAAKLHCEAQKTDNGESYVFSMGKIGPSGKLAIYSLDKKFAKINVHCAPKEITYGGVEYALKKEDNSWKVLFQTNDDDALFSEQYGLPERFE